MIDKTMNNTEKAYAFMITKTALKYTYIPMKMRLQVFAESTGSTFLVLILKACYMHHVLNFIKTARIFDFYPTMTKKGVSFLIW